jgi:hypothetical protein
MGTRVRIQELDCQIGSITKEVHVSGKFMQLITQTQQGRQKYDLDGILLLICDSHVVIQQFLASLTEFL